MEIKEKRSRKSCPRLGVLTAWFYGHYQAELISGIEEAARRLHTQVVYFSGRALDSPVPHENNHNIIYDTALNASLDGVIILSLLTNYCDDNTLAEFISRYKDIPLITINFRSLYGNAILTNNTSGFRDLMNHLIKKHGYRKIAFVKGPPCNLDACERYDVYTSVLSENGIGVHAALVTEGAYTFRAGQEAVRMFLDQRSLKPGQDIEVVVCANDAIALGVIDELYARGLQVPGDLAVTGFDNVNESIFPKFPLTSVKQHLREIGNQAVCHLLDYKENRDPLYFDTELVIRSSCGCLVPGEWGDPGPEYGRNQEITGSQNVPVYKKDLEFIYYEIIRIIDELKDLQKRTELSAWMQRNFSSLGIESAWLFLYSRSHTSIPVYTLLSGYDMKEEEKIVLDDKVSENDIFEIILSKRPDRSYCIFPLLFKEKKYGLLVMEVHIVTSFVYDTLSSHIGSSIKNIFLGEEVTAINRQLRKSNEQKSRFFINMAHETKTPLTLIQNYMELYLEECSTKANPDEKLLIIKENIDLLLANMLNFLDVERLHNGEMIYQHDTLVDLSESVRRKCDLFRVLAAHKNIRLRVKAKDHILIRIDPRALDRIFNNLLDNAVKYTQAGGRITLEVLRKNDRAVLCVNDNGPGLPADIQEHIFEPYYMLSKKRETQQGIGVGLSIVKKIIDRLGASITVGKGAGGSGTSFTIAFTDEGNLVQPESLQEFQATRPALPRRKALKERNITADKHSLFVVDDNIQLLQFIQSAFSKSYNVFLARSVEEALVKLKVISRPDLIIADVMMDGDDGFDLLSFLSAREGYNDIPFIFLTAIGGEGAKLKGLKLGAIDYIEKPFSITALKSKIESIIELRERQEKKDLERIRQRIDGVLTGININPGEDVKPGLDDFCEKYGIMGREREIIRMLSIGLLNKEVAVCMNISQRAVEYHITKIYRKCGVNNKYDLLDKFKERGNL